MNQTSVLWPFAWGLVMLEAANSSRIKEHTKPFVVVLICLITFPSDWSCIASLCILAMGTNRSCFRKQMLWMVFYVALYAIVYCIALDAVYGLLQMGVVLAIPILKLYNGQRGFSQKANRILKWGFYVYYPLHLTFIGMIKLLR